MSYKKVNKRTAKNMYDNGYTIYLIPCKCIFEFKAPWVFEFNAPWIRPIPIHKDSDGDFDTVVNAFISYNCNRELGLYPHYYV